MYFANIIQLLEYCYFKMKTLIVVGNGMVGYKFLQKLVDQFGKDKFRLITFADEPRIAYDRVHLSEYFSGKSAEDLSMAPMDWYQSWDIEVHLGERVTGIDRGEKRITTQKGKTLNYDILVLATGSAPFVPPLPGVEKQGVFVYRTIEDLEAITAYAQKSKSAAVIGGGLLGLEAAKAMVDLNLKTSVVEFASRLMPRQIDQTGSDVLVKKIKALGVDVLMNRRTEAIIGSDKVEGMSFTGDENLCVDMVVVSAGIRPQDDLAKSAGLTVGPRGGIVVDSTMKTSDESIYAIGECALVEGMIYGLVAPGYAMAETVVADLKGESKLFKGADMSTKLKLMGVDVASIGDPFKDGESMASVEVKNGREGIYKKIVFDTKTNLICGAILVGDATEYGKLLQMYQNKMSLPDQVESLIVSGGGESSAMGIDALPDEAQICSCENVSKGSIVAAIQSGCKDVTSLKKCTKAGTGCGSCVSLVTDLLTSELEKSGEAVDKSLCEHFAHTRQELVEIIKLGRITTYEDLLMRYGKGQGCEICKPAVASVLASTWNEYVGNHYNLQDTNDAFLANMQKNGTYSVVPRIPGGELTPEQLIAIGQVAQEFKLYTKITGGQRIDLFGAHVGDLPAIWKKLIAAGLETGHAYAKSLRTVKSCVGETWCRYGVGDSTQLAIDLENRYKGLRAPHKIKMAVSGCARECAEAQGKDIGVIATEKGWNLYVCGNGGMKPQHAVLFAADIDRETLFKYIDRILMYYVRTADRLTRTATWLNKLPGGLAKLKAVVIEDTLGLGEELVREMNHIVSTYQCEWKTTVENPEALHRFSHFVNVPEKDDRVTFEKLRGQLQPFKA
jgi:nitrite reductase (NADH) large subunit